MKAIFVFIVIFLFPLESFGEDSRPLMKKKTDEEIVKEIEKHSRRRRRSSFENRIGKNFQLSLGLGLETDFIESAFLKFGYFSNPDQVFELKLSYGEEETEDIFGETENGIERIFIASLGVKLFVGNTFYIKPAVEYVEHTDEADFLLLSLTKEREKIEGFAGAFYLGNEWQFDNLSIGCDWFGLRYIISETESINNPDELSLSFLLFNVGFSF